MMLARPIGFTVLVLIHLRIVYARLSLPVARSDAAWPHKLRAVSR
jgi:hypothetical protein